MACQGSSILVCLLCVALLPSVWAEVCNSHWTTTKSFVQTHQCGFAYCCGSCSQRYCCGEKEKRLTSEDQDKCPGRPDMDGFDNTGFIVALVLGSVTPIIFCVGTIICFVAPCCLLNKQYRKRHGRAVQTVENFNNLFSTLQQSALPSGNHPPHPGYELGPVHPGYGGLPNPTALAPYLAVVSPPLAPGQPLFADHPSAALPPHSDELAQPPNNPV